MLMFLLGIFALAAVLFLILVFVGLATSSIYAFLGIAAVLAFAWWIAGKDWGIGKVIEATMPPEPEPRTKRAKRAVQPDIMPGQRTSLDNPWTDEDDLA